MTKAARKASLDAESDAAAAAREVAAAMAELKSLDGGDAAGAEKLAKAEARKKQLDALQSAKACIAASEQARAPPISTPPSRPDLHPSGLGASAYLRAPPSAPACTYVPAPHLAGTSRSRRGSMR